MRFQKLIISNYKTFRKRTEIDFTKNLGIHNDRNIFLIGGMNGAGKTTIMEAINLCLYGDKKLERIYQSINQHEKDLGNFSSYIELHMQLDTDENLILKRSWNIPYTFKDATNYDDLKEEIVIIKNDKKVLNNQYYLEYLKSNIPSSITQFFFFDGEKIQQMAADEYSAMNLKNSMESALGIELTRKLIEDLENIRKKEAKDEDNITTEDIQLKENEIEILKKQVKQKENAKLEYEEQIIDLNNNLSKTKQKFSLEFGINPEELKQKDEKEKTRIKISNRIAEIDQDIKKYVDAYFSFGLLIPFFGRLRKQIELERKIELNESIQKVAQTLSHEIIDEINNFENTIRKNPLNVDEISYLKKRIFNIVNKYRGNNQSFKSNEKYLNLSKEDTEKIKIKLENIEKQILLDFGKYVKEKRNLLESLEKIEKELMKITFEGSKGSILTTMQNNIEGLSTQIGRKKAELTNIIEAHNILMNQIVEKEKELERLYENYTQFSKKAALLKKFTTIIKLLNEYIDTLRESKIKQLQSCTSYMFKQLLTKGENIDELIIDPQTYLITIKNTSGQIIHKQDLAAGEKEIFAISLLWGLAKTSQLKLPIIIDTPLSRLDSEHRDKIVRYYFPNAGQQVIILSTDTEVDKKYYKILENHLKYAIHLNFDKNNHQTIINEGYFWGEN